MTYAGWRSGISWGSLPQIARFDSSPRYFVTSVSVTSHSARVDHVRFVTPQLLFYVGCSVLDSTLKIPEATFVTILLFFGKGKKMEAIDITYLKVEEFVEKFNDLSFGEKLEIRQKILNPKPPEYTQYDLENLMRYTGEFEKMVTFLEDWSRDNLEIVSVQSKPTFPLLENAMFEVNEEKLTEMIKKLDSFDKEALKKSMLSWNTHTLINNFPNRLRSLLKEPVRGGKLALALQELVDHGVFSLSEIGDAIDFDIQTAVGHKI